MWNDDEWLQKYAGQAVKTNDNILRDEQKAGDDGTSNGDAGTDADTTPKTTASSANPQVFLDIKIDSQFVGRLVILLRKDVVPLTAENFRSLCTHEAGFGYRGCSFHRIIPGFMVNFKCLHGFSLDIFLCRFKAVILPITTALEANRYMERNLKMKTLF